MLSRDDDRGQLTLLIIGLVAIAALLIVVAIDVSKVFLARRALSSAVDAAALAAAQAVDKAAVYRGDGGCGNLLPLDSAQAASYADAALTDDEDDLRQTFASLDAAQTDVQNGTVTVHVAGDVAVPFGKVLALLLPGHADGRVHVDATAHAQSPLTAPGGC
jgi:uncharacterized membrane protein